MQVIRTPLYGLKPMLLISMITDNHTCMGHASPLVLDKADINKEVLVLVDKTIIVKREWTYDPNNESDRESGYINASTYTNNHENELPGFAVNDVYMDEFGRVCIALHGNNDSEEIVDRPVMHTPRAADFISAVEHLSDVFKGFFKVYMSKWYILDKVNHKFSLKVRYPKVFEYESQITREEYEDIRDVLRAFFCSRDIPNSKFTTAEQNPIVIESSRVKKKNMQERMSKLIGIMNDEYNKLLQMADGYENTVLEKFSK